MENFTPTAIRKSRAEALEKIKSFLDADDVDQQFADRHGGYYSKDKFIVTWLGHWKTIPSEFGIDKTDAFYRDYSGNAAIYATRSLFHEKQIEGYSSIERALIDVGMKLCTDHEAKVEFFEKYAEPYNERILKAKAEKAKNDPDKN